MTVSYCCRCGAKTGVFGLCSTNPDHAPHDTPEDMVCPECGCLMKLGDTLCSACALSAMTDSPLVERD